MTCQVYAPAALCAQGNSLVSFSVSDWVDPGLLNADRRNRSLENFQGSSEPGTSRLVAQYSNHLRHLSPRIGSSTMNYRVFFFLCLTAKSRSNAPPALRIMPLVGEL